MISLRDRKKQPCHPLPVLFTIIVEILFSTKQGREAHGIYVGKKETKLSLLKDDVIIHVKNLTKSIKDTRTDK